MNRMKKGFKHTLGVFSILYGLLALVIDPISDANLAIGLFTIGCGLLLLYKD